MNTDLTNLEPKAVWKHFHALTQIPRPSGKKEQVSQFLADFGRKLGLETLVDETGNVLIRKPASAGYESHPGVVIQGHMDMVPQKDSDCSFDFEKDPIRAYIDGEWVTADHTTLGADNGIGVATAMAIMADNTLKHPALEALFTVDEETGMYGAFALQGGFLQGKTLLNLDSETEGELYIGCAGGVDTTATFDYTPVDTEEGDIALRIRLTGLKGGHSGCDINLQRANANKLLFRFLKDAVANYEARLAYVAGGSLRNAIPLEAEAIITIPADGKDEMLELVDYYENLFITEYDGVEDNIHFSAQEVECPKQELPEDVQDFLIHAICVCPHGVFRRMPEMPEIVETSTNLAIIETHPDKIVVMCLTRSSIESHKAELREMIHSAFSMAGARVEFSGDYPGWKTSIHSNILHLMQDVYEKEFGSRPRILIIHAGLECGIIGRNYPGMEMVSFGPTIEHPHSPDERVNIQTVQKFYHFVTATLEKL